MNLKTEFDVRSVDRAVSSRFGIANRVWNLQITSHDFPLFFNFEFGSKNVWVGGADLNGSASGPTWEESYLAAVVEHLERYALSFPGRSQRVLFGSADSLAKQGYRVPSPQNYSMFSDEQYAHKDFDFKRFTSDLEMDWVPAEDLTQQNEVLVPRCLVTWSRKSEQPRVSAMTTNGAGAGFTKTRAIKSGVLELVERDSFNLHWWTKTPLRRLDFSKTANAEVRNWLERFRPFPQFEFFLARTEFDLFPIICIQRGDVNRGEPAFSINGACDVDPFTAVKKAFREGVQGILGRRHMPWQPIESMEMDFDKEIQDFKDGQRIYAHPKNAKIAYELLTSPSEQIDFDDLPSRLDDESRALEHILQTFKDNGHSLFVADRTPRDLERIGLVVVKTISPALLELNAAHLHRRWGGKRLFEFRRKFGYASSDLTVKDLNPLPHPFP